ncbi:MAG: hypothetical protein ACK5LK_06890 [Chthoniobacterales bacterium]
MAKYQFFALMSDFSPDLHPQYRALIEENAFLREELSHLLTLEHDLLHTQKPNLYALYQKKIGAWELRALHARTKAMEAKRRLELAQAAINQGDTPDFIEIDKQLELEFITWRQRIAEAAENLEAAKKRLDNSLSDEQSRELKKLYHALVRKLHPDVQLNLGEKEKRLWLQVQAAYDACDIEELKTLSLLIEKNFSSRSDPSALEALQSEGDALRRRISVLEKRLEEIESEPPFTLREDLGDEQWVASRREELEKSIVQFEQQGNLLETYLKTLYPIQKNDGKLFGSN